MERSEFEKLFGECSKFVERYVYRRTPNKFDGDDVIQEVYLAACEKYGELDGNVNFKAWMLSVARNKCADYYRRRNKSCLIVSDSEAVDSLFAEQNESHSAVAETLERMREKDRHILTEFYISGKTQKEIAAEADCSVGTVKSRLYTAKNKFRELYPYPLGKEYYYMKLPKILPEIRILRLQENPFDVICTQEMGYFISPVIGEEVSFAIYDFNEKSGLERTSVEMAAVKNKAKIHGVECVEIAIENEKRYMSHFVRLTETHLQNVAFCNRRKSDGTVNISTFLDDKFFGIWGFGENNCGEEILRIPRGIIAEPQPDEFVRKKIEANNLDICGRFSVEINNKVYDTVRSIYFNSFGELVENYIDGDGRCVYFRRFDRTDAPVGGRSIVTLNGDIYEHTSSAVADYVL